jgi:hypothetical protein
MPELISLAAVPLSEGKVALYALDDAGRLWKLIDPDDLGTGWHELGGEPRPPARRPPAHR